MATKGTVVKSMSSSSSNELVKIEERLKALEEKAHDPCQSGNSDEDRIASLEAKVEDLISRLSKKMSL